jgi:Na+-transporting NADH:ubiquinone oxidoreductase subunit C
MAINKNNTAYTFIFSIVMVVVVGAGLAYTSLSLKPLQKANSADKQKMDILFAIQVNSTRETADSIFSSHVLERVALNPTGSLDTSMTVPVDSKNSLDPFNIDIKKDYRSYKTKRDADGNIQINGYKFPLYVCEKDGQKLYVVPVVGSGLWGPIWGYVALKDDMKTIFGASFAHKTETPGLGAEINTAVWAKKFQGKLLREAKPYFDIIKGGKVGDDNQVDGITGGTITSKGVEEMMNRTLEVYDLYFKAIAEVEDNSDFDNTNN